MKSNWCELWNVWKSLSGWSKLWYGSMCMWTPGGLETPTMPCRALWVETTKTNVRVKCWWEKWLLPKRNCTTTIIWPCSIIVYIYWRRDVFFSGSCCGAPRGGEGNRCLQGFGLFDTENRSSWKCKKLQFWSQVCWTIRCENTPTLLSNVILCERHICCGNHL